MTSYPANPAEPAQPAHHVHPGAHLFQRFWTSTVLLGVITVILGVVVLAWPGRTIVVAAVLFGVYLAVSGVAQFIFALTLPVSAGGRILLLLSGAASIILAVLAFRHFGQGIAVLLLAIWIAVGFGLRGVSAVAAAISDPGYPGRGWAVFFGVVSLIASVVVLAYPFDSVVTLALVAGSWLVIIGVLEILHGLGLRSGLRKIQNVTHVAT